MILFAHPSFAPAARVASAREQNADHPVRGEANRFAIPFPREQGPGALVPAQGKL